MQELLVILVLGLLLLGPKKLPELARSLGRGLAEFRRASSEMRREFLDVAEEARAEPQGDASAKAAQGPAVPPSLEEAPASATPEPPPRPPGGEGAPTPAEAEKAPAAKGTESSGG